MDATILSSRIPHNSLSLEIHGFVDAWHFIFMKHTVIFRVNFDETKVRKIQSSLFKGTMFVT